MSACVDFDAKTATVENIYNFETAQKFGGLNARTQKKCTAIYGFSASRDVDLRIEESLNVRQETHDRSRKRLLYVCDGYVCTWMNWRILAQKLEMHVMRLYYGALPNSHQKSRLTS